MVAKMSDTIRLRCERCQGCGEVASTEEAEPWTYWDELPRESKAAVYMGVVYPVRCEACAGEGYIVPDEQTQAALAEVIAAAMRRLDKPGPDCNDYTLCVKLGHCAAGCGNEPPDDPAYL